MRLSARLHSLWRGFLSVAYFYLACSPYHVSRRKRAQQKQDRQEQQQKELRDVELGASDQYQHPASFGLNPYWTHEIALGPGPPSLHQTKKQRAFLKRLRGPDGLSRPETPINNGSGTNVQISTTDGEPVSRTIAPGSERWKLIQREDDVLWGSDAHLELASLSSKDTATGTYFRRYASHIDNKPRYVVACNPPINDLSPPIVSNPAQNSTSNMWMLQPPPRAKVMSGHESLNRSRSTTMSSASSQRAYHAPLSRQLSRRLMEEKVNRSSLLFPNPRHMASRSTLVSSTPTESSIIEASYDLGSDDTSRDSSRISVSRSNGSSASVIRGPRSTYDEKARDTLLGETIASSGSAFPGPAFAIVNGTHHQDFAFPYAPMVNRARSSTVPESHAHHITETAEVSKTSPRYSEMAMSLSNADEQARTVASEALEPVDGAKEDNVATRNDPGIYRPKTIDQHFLRRWSVDF